jgi:hypothetical protein
MYTKLSDSGNVLGLTTYADVDVGLERNKRTETIHLAGDTVLLDERLYPLGFSPHKEAARRRFTLAHECSYSIAWSLTNSGKRLENYAPDTRSHSAS